MNAKKEPIQNDHDPNREPRQNLTFRPRPEVRAALLAQAEKEHKTVSAVINEALAEALGV